jgi:DNA primase
MSTSPFELVREFVLPHHYYFKRISPSRSKSATESWIDGGLCPFHADKRAGSFRVNVKTGAYRCFSCGHSGGDIIDFESRYLGCSLYEAAKRIAEQWGLVR